MSQHERLRRVLEVAVYAPSGDNTQPWHFKIGDNCIYVFNISNRDETLYNFRQRGSYIGHGALIENILIAAEKDGLAGSVRLFPGDENCTACISFAPLGASADSLYSSIIKRSTNRKPYSKKELETKDRDALLASVKKFPGVDLKLIDNREQLDKIAVTLSLNERLLMENRGLHDFLFGIIRWTEQEELQSPGLYVKTMEFPAPVRFLMKYLLRHWRIASALNNIGLSKGIAKQSSELYKASSAFCAIVIQNDRDTSFIEAGRAFQRVWLTATERGLSMQPVTAIPYLAQRVREGEANMFTKEHVGLIRGANSEISSAFHLDGNMLIAMLFRIGYDGEPTARSAKLPPIVQ